MHSQTHIKINLTSSPFYCMVLQGSDDNNPRYIKYGVTSNNLVVCLCFFLITSRPFFTVISLITLLLLTVKYQHALYYTSTECTSIPSFHLLSLSPSLLAFTLAVTRSVRKCSYCWQYLAKPALHTKVFKENV